MPGRDGPENLRILKESQLTLDIGPWRQTVKFLPLSWEFGIRPLSRRVDFFRIPTGRDELRSITLRDILNVGVGLA